MKVFTWTTLAVTVFAVLCGGCKKDSSPAQNNNNTSANCNFTTDVVVVDGVSKTVVHTNAQAIGTGYIVEFLTDNSASPTGLALAFSATPAAGDYAIQPDATAIVAGQVYVEYYDPSTAWHGMSGTVKITANGSQKVVTFCSQDLFASATNKKTVSVRGSF